MDFLSFLVKRRNILLVIMMALAVVCGTMIPKLNIIMEITYFLPDDSPMKHGLDQMEEDFPGMKGQLSMLSVMLENVEDKDAEQKVLNELTGGLICMSVKDNGPYTLYQYLLTQDCDYEARRQDIKRHYDGDVVVEVDLDKNMPADIIPMIASGAVLVFIILLVMCSSVMEVLLFLFTTLIAVAINMGSNILLEGVSYMTNTMVAVLQMILSMDYSIIIMNRFRQEKANYPGDNPRAMAVALRNAAPSVLSSCVTTVASLLMLMFMHLKIGMDLGLVLSKGVLLSMICNFTVLPALILLFDKAIVKTEKKIPQFPARDIARFEVHNRVLLTILFVGIFIAAFILQKRTEVSFAAIWETEIAKQFPPQNPMVLMYETEEEDAIPGIMDTLQRDPKVISCISYPGLIKEGHSVKELTEEIAPMSPMITEDIVKAVFYSYTHPERNERLSLNEIQDLAEELSEKGLVPSEFDVKAMMARLTRTAPVSPKPPVIPAPAAPVATSVPDSTVAAVQPADSTLLASAVSDSLHAVQASADSVTLAKPDSVATAAVPEQDDVLPIPTSFTYEMVTEQLSAKQLSERYGIERSYVNMLYRMAGRTRKPATMSLYEVASFANNRLLNDKRYSGFVTSEQVEMFKSIYHQVDSAFVAGPTPVEEVLIAEADGISAPVDTVAAAGAADSLVTERPVEDVRLAQAETPVASEPEEDDEPIVLTPLERLAEMAFSGRKYNSRTVRYALAAAGIRVSQSDMDLLYMYAGSRKWNDRSTRMSIGEFVNYLNDTLLQQESFARFMDEDSRRMLSDAVAELNMAATTLRSDRHSIAAIMTDYEFESPETFSFVDRLQKLSDRSLSQDHVIISESAMYKEIKEEFPDELLLLTVLTILSIFIIVALTFKSLIIPVFLVLAVMSGVYVNVFVSGLNGHTMYFMSYLVVQSILMGATIDYSILFTSYYREHRMRTGVPRSIMAAYHGAGHSIMTSGLILTLAPFAMSLFIKDQMIAMILKCLATGALSAILIIFFILPGAIALCDFLVAPKGAVKSFGNK